MINWEMLYYCVFLPGLIVIALNLIMEDIYDEDANNTDD